MKFMKIFTACTTAFAAIAGGAAKAVEFADRMVHYREFRAAEKRAKVIRTVLMVLGGILLVLFVPYKVRIEKNGDYEIRTLVLKMSRKTEPNDLESAEDELELGLDEVDENVEVLES